MEQLSHDHVAEDTLRSALPDHLRHLAVFCYDEIDSTNTEAKRMLMRGFSEDAVIVANKQTAGRGRLGRSFYSPAQTGIYVSYILHPNGTLEHLVSLTTAAAVAVDRAIRKLTDQKPEIKWVNDLYLDGKKICGILAETVTRQESQDGIGIVIGIGLNLSTEVFPAELSGIAGSLQAPHIKKSRMIAAITEELFRLAEHPENQSYMEDYRAHSMVLGRHIVFAERETRTEALVTGIDDDGGLIVRLDDGTERVLFTGEISLRLSE